MAKVLLAHGANVNVRDLDRDTTLAVALLNDKHREMQTLLLQLGGK